MRARAFSGAGVNLSCSTASKRGERPPPTASTSADPDRTDPDRADPDRAGPEREIGRPKARRRRAYFVAAPTYPI